MLAKIHKVTFKKTFNGKFGPLHSFEVAYSDMQETEKTGKTIERIGYYSSQSEKQEKIKAGEVIELTEEKKKGQGGQEYTTVKPTVIQRVSNFGKALDKEKARYSGFAVSYAKDLVVAGKIEFKALTTTAWDLHKLMVDMDKTLEK
jgi:ribosomal protein S16